MMANVPLNWGYEAVILGTWGPIHNVVLEPGFSAFITESSSWV